MTFLEAVYGSQYNEISQKGKDGNKGRLNGNIFLSAMIILLVIAILMLCISFVPGFDESITRSLRSVFGYSSGKSIGQLLAIPVFAIIYLVVAGSVGNQYRFKKYAENFMQYPDTIKKKANVKILLPFFVLLAIVFGLAIMKL